MRLNRSMIVSWSHPIFFLHLHPFYVLCTTNESVYKIWKLPLHELNRIVRILKTCVSWMHTKVFEDKMTLKDKITKTKTILFGNPSFLLVFNSFAISPLVPFLQ